MKIPINRIFHYHDLCIYLCLTKILFNSYQIIIFLYVNAHLQIHSIRNKTYTPAHTLRQYNSDIDNAIAIKNINMRNIKLNLMKNNRALGNPFFL